MTTSNGRVVNHAFGQFFMIWPKTVFNICNALVYMGLLVMMSRI